MDMFMFAKPLCSRLLLPLYSLFLSTYIFSPPLFSLFLFFYLKIPAPVGSNWNNPGEQVYLCVADGVGSWRQYGVDPRAYSHKLVENARKVCMCVCVCVCVCVYVCVLVYVVWSRPQGIQSQTSGEC
jgi:hypothetical protein